jgi:hypothetical protein
MIHFQKKKKELNVTLHNDTQHSFKDTQDNETWDNDAQHKETVYNGTQYYETQHHNNDTQYNYTLHTDTANDNQHISLSALHFVQHNYWQCRCGVLFC